MSVSYCDLGVDGCSAYLETINPDPISLHLAYYEGDEIDDVSTDADLETELESDSATRAEATTVLPKAPNTGRK